MSIVTYVDFPRCLICHNFNPGQLDAQSDLEFDLNGESLDERGQGDRVRLSPQKRRHGGDMARYRNERSRGDRSRSERSRSDRPSASGTSILPNITHVKQEEETDPERLDLAEQFKPNAKGYYALCYPKERLGNVSVKGADLSCINILLGDLPHGPNA